MMVRSSGLELIIWSGLGTIRATFFITFAGLCHGPGGLFQ